MYAIIDLNGKQYEVEEGRYVVVDRLPHDPEAAVDIENVLMVVDGESSVVGAPFIEGANVKAKVLDHFRGSKVTVYKMKPKKGYRRKKGHRQDYTRLQIEGLEIPGKKTASKPKKAAKKADEGEAKAKPKAKTAKKTETKAKAEVKSEKKETKKTTAKKTTKAKAEKKAEKKTESKED